MKNIVTLVARYLSLCSIVKNKRKLILNEDFKQLVKKHLLSHTILDCNSNKIEFSKSDILHFFENGFIENIRQFDYLLERCFKDIEPLKTNIVVVELEISQDEMDEIDSKKEMLEKDISHLIKMTLSFENADLNSALYLLINKINNIKNDINKFNVEYFNYTGGLTEELTYFKKVLLKN